jgi:predicted GIY-YIG superfamily endonuclease
MDNQQLSSVYKGKSSTTISKESTGSNTGKRPIYLRLKNVIYKITNIANNKIYIGSASYYDKRMWNHITKLRDQTHHNKHLQNAWNKYGELNFRFEIIEQVDCKENLIKREQYYIDLYKPFCIEIGYNINKKAESRLGGKMPESAKIKIGNFWRGKKHSKERIQRLKEDRTLNQGKSILVYDNDFNFINEYPSLSETSRQLGVSIATICKQCKRNSNKKRKRKDSIYNFKYKDIV